MSVKVAGLDLSMTATGATHTLEGGACTHEVRTKAIRDRRLTEIADRVAYYAEGSDLVLIEGYLNHSHSAGITGMVHGAVRAKLIELGLAYATIPPSSLKKYATGRGAASKTDMALAAFKRGEVEFKTDNECDSWWLWAAANEWLGHPVVTMPKAQVEALSTIKREG